MSILPSTDLGFLPFFLLYTSVAALIHTVVTYTHPVAALTQFSGSAAPPPHPLTAHVYGIKNLNTGLIRLFAAYHIGNQDVYDLAICTFVGVLVLYGGELLIWKTSRIRELIVPLITSGTGLWWMLSQRSWYLSH